MSQQQGQTPPSSDSSSPSWPFLADHTKDFVRRDAALTHSLPETTEPGMRYHVSTLHARGGLGEVYRARDQELQRMVALKRLPHHYARYSELRERFRREAEITACLEHPGIVPVYGMIQDEEGRPAYAMRFIDGETLFRAVTEYMTGVEQDHLKRREFARQTEFRQLLHRFIDVCNTVAYAHSRGVIHRDIKPQNIMLGQFGETLLVDWGLAKRLVAPVEPAKETVQVHATDTSRIRNPHADTPAEEPKAAPNDLTRAEDTRVPAALRDATPDRGAGAPLTQMGQAVGTPQYMSPEQAAGEPHVGTASDIYNLGATLYFMLTGKPPFTGKEWGKVQHQICSGHFPRPQQVRPDVPAPLEAICLKAMALHAEDRYISSLDLAADLEKWLAHEPVSAWEEPWTMRVRRWMARHRHLVTGVVILLCTALIATTSALIAVQNEKEKTEKALAAEKAAAQVIADLGRKTNEEAAKVKAENESFRKLFITAGKLIFEEVFTQRANLAPEDVAVLDSMLEHYQKFSATKQVDFDTRVQYALIPWHFANIYQRLGHHKKAEQGLLIAKEQYQKLLEEYPNAPCCRAPLGQVYDQLGRVLSAQKRWQEAEVAHKEGVKILSQLISDYSDSPLYRGMVLYWNQGYASALHNYGMTLGSLQRYQEAEDLFHDAGKIRKELAAKYPKSQRFQHLLATHYVHLAKLYANRNKYAEATEQARLAKPIFLKLIEKMPDSADMWFDLAICHADLGLYLALQEQWTEADQALQDAMVAQELLFKKYPGNADYALHLGTIYRYLAVLKAQSGRYNDALHLTDVAIFVLKPLTVRDAWSGHSKTLLRDVYEVRAKAKMGLKELLQAVLEAKEADKLSEPDRKAESQALLSQTLARADEWQEAEAIAATVGKMPSLNSKAAFTLACTYARLAQPVPDFMPQRQQLTKRAMQLLQQAEREKLFASSFMRVQLNTEEDFTSLRQLPAFRELSDKVLGPEWMVNAKGDKAMGRRDTAAPQRP